MEVDKMAQVLGTLMTILENHSSIPWMQAPYHLLQSVLAIQWQGALWPAQSEQEDLFFGALKFCALKWGLCC